MSKLKELDLPLLAAVGTACTLATILAFKTTSAPAAPQQAAPFPPRPPDTKNASELESMQATSPRARSRTMSSGNLRRSRSSENLQGEQSVRLVVSDTASKNTVEALLAELVQLQERSADIKITGTGAFSDVARLVRKQTNE